MLKDAYRFTRTVRIKLFRSTRAYRNLLGQHQWPPVRDARNAKEGGSPLRRKQDLGGRRRAVSEGGECVCTAVFCETGGGEGRSYGRQLQNVNASSPC